ncbi:MAG: hypothetical protein ABIO65_00005, partial [Nitrospiria bacterium]
MTTGGTEQERTVSRGRDAEAPAVAKTLLPFERMLSAPAHVHHTAFWMKDPPSESRLARAAFERTLAECRVPAASTVLADRWGYGVLDHPSGDRLIVRWQLHTEYYSYQVWYLPADPAHSLRFGPLEWPGAALI